MDRLIGVIITILIIIHEGYEGELYPPGFTGGFLEESGVFMKEE